MRQPALVAQPAARSGRPGFWRAVGRGARGAWQGLASLKLTLLGMLALGGGIIVRQLWAADARGWLLWPLLLLALNLLAVLSVRRRFWRQPGLLVFHLGLLAIFLLAAYGELRTFNGRVEIAVGQQLADASIEVVRRGAWHDQDEWRRLDFRQQHIEVAYAPGLKRGATASQILVPAGSALTVGDNRPLQLGGYRFYTTSNKGHATLLHWRDAQGHEQRGLIHFPSYPRWDWKQLRSWVTPAGQSLQLRLNLPALHTQRDWVLSSREIQASLTLLLPDGRELELQPGASLELGEHVLWLEQVTLWLGYEIVYNPALPGLFVIAFIAVLGLAVHWWRRRPLAAPVVTAGDAMSGERYA